jgi:hypothetical protein
MKKINYKQILMSFFAALALVACGPSSDSGKVGKDGYYFEKETFTRTYFPMEIVLMPSAAALSAEIAKRNNVQGTVAPKNVAAFSVIRQNDLTCTVYMVDPKVKYEPEFYGHELVHCIYGVWHREPQLGRN